jgi:hypothetical protein
MKEAVFRHITLVVTANVVPSSPVLVTLMMEAVRFSETCVTRATQRNILEDGTLHKFGLLWQ